MRNFAADLLASEDILTIRPSEALQNRVRFLLEKGKTTGLTPEEEQEWRQYEDLEHLVRVAKTRALLKRTG